MAGGNEGWLDIFKVTWMGWCDDVLTLTVRGPTSLQADPHDAGTKLVLRHGPALQVASSHNLSLNGWPAR